MDINATAAIQTAFAQSPFTMRDQENFAAISGDYNPMHMNPVVARRTPAGACVVHGVQSLLWALEQLAGSLPLNHLRALDADFAQFLYVDEPATLHLVKSIEQEARAELRIGDVRISQYVLKFGPRTAITAPQPATSTTPIHYPATASEPLPLTWPEVETASGTVEYAAADSDVAKFYPVLSAAIGAGPINGILSLTRLVGMVSPGLHSTFHRINIQFTETPDPLNQLHFSTSKGDPRFAVATISVSATGITGSVKASRRQPPTNQASAASLRTLVKPDQFTGHTALIIGGSRGLGEVTAKLLAMGGAQTIISYAQGAAEAQAVIADITAAGGQASAIHCDVTQPLAPQLSALPNPPTSVYFFATPRISGRAPTSFSAALFNRFNRVYIEAFHELCTSLAATSLAAGRKTPLQVFYPSTIFVSEPTKTMAEYAMSKAAGEALANDLTRFTQGIEVDIVRLPRLPTDQTASMIEQTTSSAADTMLPIIERIEARVT
jgi:NAD(P)-dependent dehydrogenase (short-subunit alcohol dehydrogenase family)